jgi:hypothetical protein
MTRIISEIVIFMLIAPPLQPEVVLSFPGTRCMVTQSFAAEGN